MLSPRSWRWAAVRRTGLVLILTVALTWVIPAPVSGAATDIPDGFLSGEAHALRVRPILGEVAPEPKHRLRPPAARVAAAAMASCDLAQVTKVGAVPSTDRPDDIPSACVVNSVHPSTQRARRYLLGPSRLTGSDVASVRVSETRVSRKATPTYTVGMKLTDRGAAAFAADPSTTGLAVVVDGEIVPGTLSTANEPINGGSELTLTYGAKPGTLSRAAATRLVRSIDQARSEEVIGFAEQLTMTRDARAIFAANAPRIDDKGRFAKDCPIPDAQGTFVLGCQGGDRIFLLRVDRPDLAQIMSVTAAHEMLHAAYARLDPAERRRIDRLVDEAFTSSTDQRLRDLVTEYDKLEPGERRNELHSLLGTEATTLSRPLERYYRRYFRDRTRIVEAFNGYQSVFDALRAQYEQLKSEVDGLEAQLQGLSGQLDAAGGEADQLAGQIESLRSQGRIEESNRLVGTQNAAVNRAHALADRYNGLVDEYNAKVNALNALAIAGQQLDDAISTTVAVAPEG